MNRKAIIIGATGLVGSELCKQLSALYNRVIIIARNPPQVQSSNMLFYQVNDFASMSDIFESIDIDDSTDAFSCLGTTRKQAGSEQAFKNVDYHFNLLFAECCYNKQVKHFFLLSAMGADTKSKFFYNQVKGELEEAILQIGFQKLFIFRPSLLLGKHKGRHLENLSQNVFRVISPLVSEKLPAHPITYKRVAIAMAMMAHELDFDESSRHSESNPLHMIISNKKMLAMTKINH